MDYRAEIGAQLAARVATSNATTPERVLEFVLEYVIERQNIKWGGRHYILELIRQHALACLHPSFHKAHRGRR